MKTKEQMQNEWNALIDASNDNVIIDYMMELGYFDMEEINGESLPVFDEIAERGCESLTDSDRDYIKNIIFAEAEKFNDYDFLEDAISGLKEKVA